MPQAKAKPQAKPQAEQNSGPVVEVVLPTGIPKKHSVRFETDEAGVDVDNLYLRMAGFRKLGSPRAIKVTITAADKEA